MNKIYVFPVIPYPMGDCVYRAVAEDGEDLASQVSSSEAWGKRDLGVEGEVSPYYKDKYTAKYPGGYQIEYVPDWKRHPALVKLLPTENTPNADSVTFTAHYFLDAAREIARNLQGYGNFEGFNDHRGDGGLKDGAVMIIAEGLLEAYQRAQA